MKISKYFLVFLMYCFCIFFFERNSFVSLTLTTISAVILFVDLIIILEIKVFQRKSLFKIGGDLINTRICESIVNSGETGETVYIGKVSNIKNNKF